MSADQNYDLVVVGGTPAGVACAVRAAREGLRVLLVNRHAHLGGILSSGLAVWDTIWEGRRSPIYDEIRAGLIDYYKTTYGEKSQAYLDCLPAKTGHLVGRFESRAAEKVLTDLVAKEKNITVRTGYIPVSVDRTGAKINAVTVEWFDGPTVAERGSVSRPPTAPPSLTFTASTFADATYEGDLAALAGVPYRIGRESRQEFNEAHAGIIFMRPVSAPPTPEGAEIVKLHDQLNLRRLTGWQLLTPQSTGAADAAVQACNYRTTLTTDPANRLPIPKPAHYAPYYLRSLEIFAGIERVPNDKYGWNRPQLVGRQTGYVEADWTTRQRILDEHWEMTMGLLYFLQNDATVPGIVREAWLKFGLPKDEYADNGHRPYEIYVREARRITGRAVFTQHDAMLPSGLRRAPIHPDSIAMTEWYLDSHSCTPVRISDALEEGKVMLHQESFPGQVPYRCLLPQGVDNLLVPVCLSATHVGWNAVRLEPVFMQIGEAAGLAAAHAKREAVPVAAIDADRLVRGLCERRSLVSFFNDVGVGADEAWVPAVEYFGTKGFFCDYDARPNEPLSRGIAQLWAEGFEALKRGDLDGAALSRAILQLTSAPDLAPADGRFAGMTRGQALLSLWKTLP